MIKKGTWVRIVNVVLNPEERATNIPEETKKVPLLMWVKGRLLRDANLGDISEIITASGRFAYGKIDEVQPSYKHNYGDFVPEIFMIDDIIASERDNYE